MASYSRFVEEPSPLSRRSRSGSSNWTGLSQRFQTEVDAAHTDRLRSIIHDPPHSRILVEHKDVQPEDAMGLLLKHVKLDPDGGILNLVGSTAQRSKVPALRKNFLESALALLAFGRAVCNPLGMIVTSARMLSEYFLHGGESLRNDLKLLHVPPKFQYIFLVSNLAEFALAVVCILISLRNITLSCCYSTETEGQVVQLGSAKQEARTTRVLEPEDAEAGAGAAVAPILSEKRGAGDGFIAKPRYMYEAKFWLTDVPRLQNLSTLRLLAFAHPNLVAKNAKRFSRRDEVARGLLTKFLRLDNMHPSDELLAAEAAKLVVRGYASKGGASDEDEKREIANEFVDKKPYDTLRALRRNEGRDFDTTMCDTSVLRKAHRVDIFVLAETVTFMVVMCACFALGALEFFHKSLRCTVLLIQADGALNLFLVLYYSLFLNQVVGMLAVNTLLRWRVEVFIFGGDDAVVSAEERYIMEVYLARLMEAIWLNKDMTLLEKVSFMLQFDDDDLQRLVVEENDVSKTHVCASVRRFMYEKGHTCRFTDAFQQLVVY
uniref:Uncharacterized protein n=1 Tax=Zooxanthella nutricula TaxID=1333877 RepID=A0A7S2N9Z7_9DINO